MSDRENAQNTLGNDCAHYAWVQKIHFWTEIEPMKFGCFDRN